MLIDLEHRKSDKFLENLPNFIIKAALKYSFNRNHMSRVVRKLAFCICENKGADQLRGDREADQRLCFRYTDSKIPLLSKSEISSF